MGLLSARTQTTVQRGYGREHKLARQRYQAQIDREGSTCCYCGGPIPVGDRGWVLAHVHNLHDRQVAVDGDASSPAHRSCNLRAATRLREQRRRAQQKLTGPPYIGSDLSHHSRPWALTEDVPSDSEEGQRRSSGRCAGVRKDSPLVSRSRCSY